MCCNANNVTCSFQVTLAIPSHINTYKALCKHFIIMKAYEYFSPHLFIKELDGPLVTFGITRTDMRFACLNYIDGFDKRIDTVFGTTTAPCTVIKYIIDCLDPNVAFYTLNTNIGTRPEKVDAHDLQLRLLQILGSFMSIETVGRDAPPSRPWWKF